MIKLLKEKREALRSKGNAGFTLMELIIVIAILAMLIGMLLPRFANYTDKAMGTAAGVDTKNILTVGAAYNLDNTTQIDLKELSAETGLNATGVGGKTLTQATGANKSQFVYTYVRGGAKIVATIDLQDSTIRYQVDGTDASKFDSNTIPATLDNGKQADRIAKGLGF